MSPITLRSLESFPDQFEAHYDAIPGHFKGWAPPSWEGVPSEALTAIQQVCHVRDIEVEGYQVRLRRTLAELNPTLASIDTDAFARDRAYHAANATEVLAAFRLARAQTVNLLKGLDNAQWQRTAVFEGYGPVSLRGLVHYLCSHDQQHLAGLQWLLGKIHSTTVAP
jgi:hypothetical protein